MLQPEHHRRKAQVTRWRCPNCGQIYFKASNLSLPHSCAQCEEVVTWERVNVPVIRWECPNCGQTLFTDSDDKPPDTCHYCHDMTTWRRMST